MVASHDLLAEVGVALAGADAVQEVAREAVESFRLLDILQRGIEVEPLETGLDLDLRDGEAPDGEAGEEQVPVFGRDKTGRSCCELFVSASRGRKRLNRARTCAAVLEREEERSEDLGPVEWRGGDARDERAVEHRGCERLRVASDRHLERGPTADLEDERPGRVGLVDVASG